MSVTLRITEGEPDNYPQIVFGDDPTVEITPEPKIRKIVTTAWQRIESYIAHRWNTRTVEYIAEGCGEWHPPLSPTTLSTSEIWQGCAWVAVTLEPTPLGGYVLDGEGPYRFTGTVGSLNEPPRAVKDAVFRLVQYFLAVDETPPAHRVVGSFKTDQEPFYQPGEALPSLREMEIERPNPHWIARALQYSGAADLLRPYRKMGGV
ncbi:hypothetical protein [Hyphococcus sp.]|uniref:hypothetical protein n=1 Tax=Hyphococcus sp. TaxID=2038636 RepID=UPI00207EA915|nr:MAG: hypothetical protein DHS20C04_30520 [Marinicaulis sp.]